MQALRELHEGIFRKHGKNGIATVIMFHAASNSVGTRIFLRSWRHGTVDSHMAPQIGARDSKMIGATSSLSWVRGFLRSAPRTLGPHFWVDLPVLSSSEAFTTGIMADPWPSPDL